MSYNPPSTQDFMQYVKDAINHRLKEVADEEFAKAIERVKERRAEIITGVVLRAEEHLSYQRVGSTLQIEIRDIK